MMIYEKLIRIMKLIMEEISHSHTHHFGFFFLLISTIILINVSSFGFSKPCFPNPSYSPALFVFGSSIFDVGNNNYINTTTSNQANFLPYGDTFFKYPNGRFSDGRLIPDFIAEYANLPLRLPYLFPGYQNYIDGANFASAGAGALNETNQGFVIPLKTQLSHFREVRKALWERSSLLLLRDINDHEDPVKLLLSKAVYLFNIGTNDFAARFLNSSDFSSFTQEEYIDMVIGNMTDVIKEIHMYGGRKFGILGLGNLGCTPAARTRTGNCSEEGSDYARMHNTKLILALNKLHKELEGFKYSYTSFYDLINDMMDHPSKYGFKEGIVACCGGGPYRGDTSCGGKRGIEEYELCENPNEYVFFDYTHLTDRASQHFARQMWSGNSTFTWPYNLKMLFEDSFNS